MPSLLKLIRSSPALHVLRALPFVAAGSVAAIFLCGCGASQEGDSSLTQTMTSSGIIEAPAPGTAVRVDGTDSALVVTGTDGDYRSGSCQVDTPLPVGYPPLTPPDAIELKTYPAVRLAEVSGSGDPDRGMNSAFWPLFNHIKSHEIAMTSPVEMTYADMPAATEGNPEGWSMAFLYREPDMNAVGKEGSVVVRDALPVTVAAIGLKGDYSMALVRSGKARLEAWLEANPEWVIAGDWRALYYNGPQLRVRNKWAEVQVPVKLSRAPDGTANGAAVGAAGTAWTAQ